MHLVGFIIEYITMHGPLNIKHITKNVRQHQTVPDIE